MQQGLIDFALKEHKLMKDDPNNFSNWYAIIKDLPQSTIRTPGAEIIQTPPEVIAALYSDQFDDPEIVEIIESHVRKEIAPHIQPLGCAFVKNGTFSNKFNFTHCYTDVHRIAQSFIEINYGSMVLGAGGLTEFVVRPFIPYTQSAVGTIYNGMPLRSEFRCFYQPKLNRVLYTANYWDKEVVENKLFTLSDKIVFREMYPTIEMEFKTQCQFVERELEKYLEKAVFPELTVEYESDDIWSIDIMLDQEGNLWLIDMAIGAQSAYWDLIKAVQATHRISNGLQ